MGLPYEFEPSAPRACPICGAPLCTCRGGSSVAGGKLATENTVVRAANGLDYVIAAGDPIPDGVDVLHLVGYAENSPNTADVATNDPDSADKAESSARTGPNVIATFGTPNAEAAHEKAAAAGGYVETGGEPAADDEAPAPERPGRRAKRAELDAYAKSVGIDPSEYDSKDDLNDALDQLEDGGY